MAECAQCRFLQAKGCFSRSHTWFVYIRFLTTICSPFTPWSKGKRQYAIFGVSGVKTMWGLGRPGLDKKKSETEQHRDPGKRAEDAE